MNMPGSDFVKDKAELVKDKAIVANERARELVKEGSGLLKDNVDDLMKQSTQYARLAERRIKKNPLASVAIAAGVGVVLAGIMSIAFRSSARS